MLVREGVWSCRWMNWLCIGLVLKHTWSQLSERWLWTTSRVTEWACLSSLGGYMTLHFLSCFCFSSNIPDWLCCLNFFLYLFCELLFLILFLSHSPPANRFWYGVNQKEVEFESKYNTLKAKNGKGSCKKDFFFLHYNAPACRLAKQWLFWRI